MLSQLDRWQAYHGPLAALAVALILALAGRMLRVGLLAAVSGGAGVVAGWYLITGRLWAMTPPVSVGALTGLAAVLLLIGLLCTWLGSGRLAKLGPPLAALAAAWFLSGMPRHEAALRASWEVGLAVAVAAWVFAHVLTQRAVEAIPIAMAGLTLAAALHVAGAPAVWTQLALVPALAGLAMLALPPMPGLVALPVAVDIAALACLAVLDLGRLPRLGFASADAAALSPLLAVFLAPRLTQRLAGAGRLAPVAACAAAGGISVGCVWAVRQVVH
jgi:hypothetical protein